MRVTDVMTKDVQVIRPDESLFTAACMMRDQNVGMIPVVEGKRLIGVVTDRDIVIRGIAEKRPNSLAVEALMSSLLVHVTPEMSIDEASRLMGDAQVRRLPVVEDEQLVGILSIGDLATDGSHGQMEQAMSAILETRHTDASNDITRASLH